MDLILTLTDEQMNLLVDQLATRVRIEPSPFFTVPEAAEYMRCSEQRVRDLLYQGFLTPHKDGRRTLLLRAEIIDYLNGKLTGRSLAPIERRQAA